MQHREVVRGEEAAAAAHRVRQLGPLADRERRSQLDSIIGSSSAARAGSLRGPVEQQVAERKKKSGESGHRGISASARAIACSKRPSFFSVNRVRSTRSWRQPAAASQRSSVRDSAARPRRSGRRNSRSLPSW